MEDEIHEQWRRKLRNNIVAFIILFPDFMCQSIANAQRIKSLLRLFRESLNFLTCFKILLKINDVLGLEIQFRMPGGVKMKEEEESFNIGDFLNVEVKVEVEDITVPEIEEEEMEPKLENSLKVKEEEEKKVKKEEEKMPTMDDEEVALIKLDLDNKTIKTRASLFNFRERLGDLVGHRGGRGGGSHHWCLVCGAIASTH
jgi:hypothetical protein